MDINLENFDVVVIKQVGEVNETTCYRNFSDYVECKGVPTLGYAVKFGTKIGDCSKSKSVDEVLGAASQ